MKAARLVYAVVLALAGVPFLAGSAQAIIKDYTYQGNTFTEAAPPLTTSDSLSIELKIDCAAAGGSGDCVDLPFDDYTGAVLSFKFEAGPISIDQSTTGASQFFFSTGPDMLPVDWIMFAFEAFNLPTTSMESSRSTLDEFPTLDAVRLVFGEGGAILGISDANPGDWTINGNGTVPEPSALALFLIALGGLGVVARRRVA